MRRPFDAEPVVAALARGELPFDELAIRIDRDGRWWHRGEPIARPELVRLLASVLHRDAEGGYWLVTPAERGRVEVEDVPFLAVELAREGEGERADLRLRTNLDDWLPLDPDHPLRIATTGAGPVPYVRVRGRLEARIVPSVYYELAELAVAGEDGRLGVWSAGSFFPLEPEAAARG
ncbi:MAG: DUF1285 domain-containing protein [Geminicoccaceae bacterium]|nr:DUF1285 domain-containing protein [Geminicoccaceae bacterium]MCX8101880.1 DUF1285 domain-containing protein [Geminicoccaceae bacterium]MDW8370443.1 DUF1285 domain-containing protein [Geminicoccaceae bacterium]